MKNQVPRREFLHQMAATAAFAIPAFSLEELSCVGQLYPPTDLSYFEAPISPAPAEIHIGYAAITWSENDRKAIEDISALGFRGIQLRANAVNEFGDPSELRELLQKHKLKMVALSSGSVRINAAVEAEEIAKHTANARFAHDVGGLFLQVIDELPKGSAVVAEDYVRLGQLLTEIGKRTADFGISLGYHNHMGTRGESPEGVDRILEAADPRYVKLELDIAHYWQGGGDPAKAIETYKDRLLFLHIKDVETLPASTNSKSNYRFVELGKGQVDIPGVFAALHRANFRGWGIVELDAVPDKARTPKESAAISKEYLEKTLGVAL